MRHQKNLVFKQTLHLSGNVHRREHQPFDQTLNIDKTRQHINNYIALNILITMNMRSILFIYVANDLKSQSLNRFEIHLLIHFFFEIVIIKIFSGGLLYLVGIKILWMKFPKSFQFVQTLTNVLSTMDIHSNLTNEFSGGSKIELFHVRFFFFKFQTLQWFSVFNEWIDLSCSNEMAFDGIVVLLL